MILGMSYCSLFIIIELLNFIFCQLMSNNLAKWTEEEDELLKEGVKKYGNKWEMVKIQMKNMRTVNSIIKRWHGRIKYSQDMKVIREKTSKFTRLALDHLIKPKKQPGEKQYYPLDDKLNIEWEKTWTERDDDQLKLLVIESGILSWHLLADGLQTTSGEIKLRWRKVIYPKMIRQFYRVGGSLKWSIFEDTILSMGHRQSIDWDSQAKLFLPHRSVGSIEARWRRISKNYEVKENIENKYLARRQCLRRIAIKQTRMEEKEASMKNQKIEPEGLNQLNDNKGF